MAMFPCSVCHRVYPGRQSTMYVHLVEGATEIGGKLRLCQLCFGQMHAVLVKDAICTMVGDEPRVLEADEVPHCLLCGCNDCVAMLFAHAYAPKAERQAYMASVCKDCLAPTLETFKIAS